MNDLLKHILETPTETEVIEFKEAKNQYDTNKLGQYFSALSNEANLKGLKSAWLLFGVKNDKSIVGTTISDKQLNEYKEEIAKNTSPKIGFVEVHRVNHQEGKVIILEIPASPSGMPIAWKGHFYGRDGESLGALHLEEIQRIRNQIVQKDWSSEIVKGATIDDINNEAIAYAKRIIGTFEASQKEGKGAYSLDGKMIDMPLVKNAQKVLERAKAAGKI